MRRKAILPAVAVMIGLVTGCAVPLLTPDERKEACQFVVEWKFGSPDFKPNPLSNPVGGLAGAGLGAMQGLFYGTGSIVAVPIGAVVGAFAGTACATAALTHPTADADFESLLRAAGVDALTSTLESELNAPRADCGQGLEGVALTRSPDTVIEIAKIAVSRGCLFGKMNYWIGVEWRAVNQRTGKELCSTATRCTVTSFRNVDAWFADRGRAQAEIESALAATGRRIAQRLLTHDVLQGECQLQSNEAGEVNAR